MWCCKLTVGFASAAQAKYRDGSFAEQFVTPAECLTVIRKPELYSMPQWATLMYFSIAHGAILRGEVKAGDVGIVMLHCWFAVLAQLIVLMHKQLLLTKCTGDCVSNQVVAVTGATGGIGSCAVLLALAAGASKVSFQSVFGYTPCQDTKPKS